MNFLKLVLVSTILLFTHFLSAQEELDLSKRSEIKVNALYLILGGFELDYEYILNEESSVGVSLTSFFDDNALYTWGVTPHYRLFFSKQPALGFFVEGHVSVFGFEEDYYDYGPNGVGMYTESKKTLGGAGIAVGGKFKTSRNVVVEVNGGIGRVFGDTFFLGTYPRFGINIGKRF